MHPDDVIPGEGEPFEICDVIDALRLATGCRSVTSESHERVEYTGIGGRSLVVSWPDDAIRLRTEVGSLELTFKDGILVLRSGDGSLPGLLSKFRLPRARAARRPDTTPADAEEQ